MKRDAEVAYMHVAKDYGLGISLKVNYLEIQADIMLLQKKIAI